MNAPILSFRSNIDPNNLITEFNYSQTVGLQTGLPVLAGETSDVITFRIYNNFSTPPSSGIASATNCKITTFDDSSGSSGTTMSCVNQLWTYFQENGYGENSSVHNLLTFYKGEETAVGGATSIYAFERASNGSSASTIRAGTDTNGVGFIEFKTVSKPPLTALTHSMNFNITLIYDFTT